MDTDHGDDGLLRIGTFSTLSRISVRMLRHYQEHGVLAPALVDPFSGHRYYRSDQLAQAHLAVQLRDAGFPVEAIARLLASTADPARVDAVLDARREELSRRREELHAQLVALDQVRSTLKGHPKMTGVTVKTLPEMVTASLRRVVPRYGDEGILWQEIMPLLQRAGAPFPAGGISGATFHDPEHRESDVDIEVWVQVAETFAPIAPLVCRRQPAREIVTATLTGDYARMPAVTGALGAFLAEHRMETGPMFNIYRVSPARNPDPGSWITDVCFPVVPR
ncbi:MULTISPECIES: MerR family transcriptional regulator [Streptomyces]|uniref:MerR family transcriptional regulator n=1 Tax=Streptomyces TaxID=1883 RepID=UPI0015590B6C|nr:MerR family transcriptional regulator [Streptomyces kasugaensis]